jgi:hypothetical protein
VFPPELVSVAPYGNVLSAIAFLHGLAAEELRPEELDHHDPDYQVLIAVRAVKPVPASGVPADTSPEEVPVSGGPRTRSPV